MLVMALGICLFICAIFSFLCAFVEKRPITLFDGFIGVCSFGAFCLYQFGVYSNSAAPVNFSRFAWITTCAFSLWGAVCLCAFRLRNLLHSKIVKFVLLVFFAAGVEVFICNMSFFASHDYRPVDLSRYIVPGDKIKQDEKGYLVEGDGSVEISMKNFNQPIYNLHLAGLSYDIPASSAYNKRNVAIEIDIFATDEAYLVSHRFNNSTWQVSNLVKESHTISTWFSGNVDSLTLKVKKIRSFPIKYHFKGVIANVRREFSFSFVRFLLITLVTFLIAVFSPASSLWRKKYIDYSKEIRPVILIYELFLICAVIAVPLANPARQGIATQNFNADKWNKKGRYNFYGGSGQYGELAHSLLQGRFDLIKDPSPELANVKNPYDTRLLKQNKIPYRWDTAYYQGRYYVYFGIVPCLLFQVPYELLTGKQNLPPWINIIGMGIVFVLVVFALVKQVIYRWFPSASVAVYFLCSTTLVFATQFFNLLCRPQIYEVAILSGAVFLLLGLWQWLLAVNTTPVPDNNGKIMFHLVLGSLFIALVAGCRPQVIIFAFLCFPIFWGRYVTEKRLFTRRGCFEIAVSAVPVILVALALMYYNAARFNSPFDFGAFYNLTVSDMTKRGFNPWRIPTALFCAFLQPPLIHAVFPFLNAFSVRTNLIGQHYSQGMLGGLITCTPATWVLAALPSLREGGKAKRRGLNGFICYILCASLFIAVLDAQMGGIIYRYFMDFSPMFLLAVILCVMQLEETLNRHADSLGFHLKRFFCRALFWAVLINMPYRFFSLFVLEDPYYYINPALFAHVGRFLQFWL